MKTLTQKEVETATGLSYRQLRSLWRSGLISIPQKRANPKGRGRVSYWDSSVLDEIKTARSLKTIKHSYEELQSRQGGVLTGDQLAGKLGLKDSTLLSRWSKQGVIPKPKLGRNPATGEGRVAIYSADAIKAAKKTSQLLDAGLTYEEIRRHLNLEPMLETTLVLKGEAATALEEEARRERRSVQDHALYIIEGYLKSGAYLNGYNRVIARASYKASEEHSFNKLMEHLSINSKRTVSRWIDRGLVDRPVRTGRDLRFTKEAINQARVVDLLRYLGFDYRQVVESIDKLRRSQDYQTWIDYLTKVKLEHQKETTCS